MKRAFYRVGSGAIAAALERRPALVAVGLAALLGVTALVGVRPADAETIPAAVARPDLRVTSITSELIYTEQTRVRFTVRNDGPVTANAYVHRVDIQGVGQWLILAGSIPAGTTREYAFTITPPPPPSFRSVQVCADATNQAAESNESNNCLTKSLQLTLEPPR